MRLLSDALRPGRPNNSRGFSLMEMLVSIAIIVLLMSAVFPFIFQAQKRFQGNVVSSEANQSARAALEVLSQEIGQAGFNPQFTLNKTSPTSLTTNGCTQFIQMSDVTGISPGDWVSVDSGPNQELVQIFSTSAAATAPAANCASSPNGCAAACTVPSAPWIGAKFLMNHTTTPYAISSYKMPYGGGLLVAFDTSGNLITTPDCTSSPAPCALSNDRRLELYGDINQDQTVNYVVYSISPMVPTTTVCIPAVAPGVACPAANSYTLYNLYRSITAVPFPSIPTPTTYAKPNNSIASPMVEKVLYNAANLRGPTGSPIFSYPNTVTVGVIPNQITVVGTIVITLCVALNPTNLESNRVIWSTMATQIRPLNLAAAINVNNSNGGLYLPPTPKSLPMGIPSGYYP